MGSPETTASGEGIRKLGGMLGIARKAGKIIAGTELACDAVRQGKAALVVMAHDVSGNTRKRVTNCCSYYETALLEAALTADELAHFIGRKGASAAAAVTDESLAAAIRAIYERYSECRCAETGSAGGEKNGNNTEIQNQ